MPVSDFTCPLCGYLAPQSLFENVDGNNIVCRCCRGKFRDPNAYTAGVSYADCDSQHPVTRFPFSLNGENSRIHVRNGYMALIAGNNGVRSWVEGQDRSVNDMTEGFQLYYVCLSPQIPWGVGGLEKFGAYGHVQVSLSREYVKEFFETNRNLLGLEEHLRKLINDRITGYMRSVIARNGAGLLEHKDEYQNILGVLENGVNIIRVTPVGYRSADKSTGAFSGYAPGGEQEENGAAQIDTKPAIDVIRPPKKSYTVAKGTEEYFICGLSKDNERHKSGERIDTDMLHGVVNIVRYGTKEFEFPFGWGLYNQPGSLSGCYAATGTISFYIDSTAKFGTLLSKSKSWQDFTESFFTNVLRQEISSALREIVFACAARKDFKPQEIGKYLSYMSVEMTDMLNGEGTSAKEPPFRKYGLRVKQTDILRIDFYDRRR